MDLNEILEFFEEAAKVMPMDKSHDGIRSKLQTHMSTMHRAEHPEDSYVNHPYVQDVFGDHESGQVVYSQGGKHVMADFKKDGEGYKLKNHKRVVRAYSTVPDSEPLAAKESADVDEVTSVQESFLNKEGVGRVKIIAPGAGSMGYYTEAALRQAATDKVFHKGLQMFLDHPTDDERARSGTGSVNKLAAVLESDAEWSETAKDGPGLYADVKAFSDKMDFLNERSKNIGISMSAGVIRSRNKIDGVPVVERFAKALSVDFVSAAGAGGKLCHMYESYRERGTATGARPSAANNNRSEEMEIDEKELKTLRESAAQVPALLARLDRLEESNQTLRATAIVNEALAGASLSERGKGRVRAIVLSVLPVKDGKLDETAVRESAKKAVEDEVAYLRESGAKIPGTVSGNGGGAEPKPEENDALLTESAKILDSSLEAISGVKKGDK